MPALRRLAIAMTLFLVSGTALCATFSANAVASAHGGDSIGAAVAVQQQATAFGSSNVFRQSVRSAPTSANSAAEVANLAGQANAYYGGKAAFNVWQYNVTWYTVSSTQPTTTVLFSNCQGKPTVPSGLFGPGGQFVNVPIPVSAIPSAGQDQALTIYQPSSDTLWDFWKAYHDTQGWHACWGGRIDHVSTSPGVFAGGFGASASGVVSEAGDVSIQDVESGSINHAIALAIPAPAKWTAVSWPAQRSDGASTLPGAVPEGTRLRLDPTVNVDSLGLSPIATMIAKAAQTYGFIVTDRAGCVSVIAESGAPTAQLTGVNPWNALLGGTPSYLVMKHFPWQDLQALPQNYGSPSS